MAYKDGYIVGFFNPSEENLPEEKRYTVGLLFTIDTCYKRNGPESWLFSWFLSPSFDGHERTYACVLLSFG